MTTAGEPGTEHAGPRRTRFSFTGDPRLFALELADGLGPVVLAVLVADLLVLTGEVIAHG